MHHQVPFTELNTMSTTERVTSTLSAESVAGIDRIEGTVAASLPNPLSTSWPRSRREELLRPVCRSHFQNVDLPVYC